MANSSVIIDFANSATKFSSVPEVAEKVATKSNFLDKIFSFNFSWDLGIILFFVFVFIVYGLSFGRNKVNSLIISTYLALAVVKSIPYMYNLEVLIAKTGIFALQTFTFLIVFIALFLLLKRSVFISQFNNFSVRPKISETMAFAFLQAGLLVSIILSFLSPAVARNMSAFMQTVFMSDLGRFLWIVLPIFAMIFTKKKRRGRY